MPRSLNNEGRSAPKAAHQFLKLDSNSEPCMHMQFTTGSANSPSKMPIQERGVQVFTFVFNLGLRMSHRLNHEAAALTISQHGWISFINPNE